jgi:hypothetical protein
MSLFRKSNRKNNNKKEVPMFIMGQYPPMGGYSPQTPVQFIPVPMNQQGQPEDPIKSMERYQKFLAREEERIEAKKKKKEEDEKKKKDDGKKKEGPRIGDSFFLLTLMSPIIGAVTFYVMTLAFTSSLQLVIDLAKNIK